MDFNKDDIPVLDFLVIQCLSKGQVNFNDFINNGFAEKQKVDGGEIIVQNHAVEEFARLLNILGKTEVCQRYVTKQGQSARKNDNTYPFQRNGGFKALYRENQKEKQRRELELRKTKVDLDLAEKMLEEFPKTKIISRWSFVLGIVLAIIELYKWLVPLLS